MKGKGELFTLACVFLHQTDEAVYILDSVTGEKLWIPLSQVEDMHKTHMDVDKEAGTIVMTAWIAKKKGLI